MSVDLVFHAWSLQPFEKQLAAIEAERIAGSGVEWCDDRLFFPEALPDAIAGVLARRLSFTRAVETPQASIPTQQHILEVTAGGGNRKVTSHALHGLHPYKGKFYPQLARALINVCNVPSGGTVLDPFAGCGTTVLEASLLGIRGIGVDANPMAVLVSRAKLQLLSTPASDLRLAFAGLNTLPPGRQLPDEEYLTKWFPPNNLYFLRRILAGIERLPTDIAKDGAKVVLSSVLREGSFQDPAQLRVGRRVGRVPELEGLFGAALQRLLSDLERIQASGAVDWTAISKLGSKVVEGNSRQLATVVRTHWPSRQIDAIITSPPYASALPYIDTDRLSLRAFGMLGSSSQREAESRLIGNREVTDHELAQVRTALNLALHKSTWLPTKLHRVLEETLKVADETTSGFRKRRTPMLLFSYFRDMRTVLIDAAKLVPSGAPVAVVIGDNTAAGPNSTTLTIPTADILMELAQDIGLNLQRDLSKRLTSYGASDTVHQRNAMERERVLMFTKA